MDNLSPQKAGRNIHVVEFNEAKPRYVFQVNQSLPLTMPFGSTAALEYFHYFIPNILIGRTGKETATYLKEIAVNTKKGLDHKHMVAKILDILSRHNPWSKPENCEFRKSKAKYLGFAIPHSRVWVDPAKVRAVFYWPPPQKFNKLQSFIGFSKLYQQFIENFSKNTQPLHNLKKANTAFVWSEWWDQAYKGLKMMFVSAPMLEFTDPYKLFDWSATPWNLHLELCYPKTARWMESYTWWITCPGEWSRLKGTTRSLIRNCLQ